MRLNVVEAGEGPPVVLLHGLFGSAQNWGGIQRQLATRHRVLAIDLRNHGASPRAAAMDYPAMAADVAETMAGVTAAPAAVLGHSMGGKVAMVLALAGAAAGQPADRRRHRPGPVSAGAARLCRGDAGHRPPPRPHPAGRRCRPGRDHPRARHPRLPAAEPPPAGGPAGLAPGPGRDRRRHAGDRGFPRAARAAMPARCWSWPGNAPAMSARPRRRASRRSFPTSASPPWPAPATGCMPRTRPASSPRWSPSSAEAGPRSGQRASATSMVPPAWPGAPAACRARLASRAGRALRCSATSCSIDW